MVRLAPRPLRDVAVIRARSAAIRAPSGVRSRLLVAFLAQRRQISYVTALGMLAALVLTLAAPAAAADVLIGTAGPLTGSNAWLGEQLRQGAQMAVRDLNGSGGVLGEKPTRC